MCGIAGIKSIKARELKVESALSKMLGSISHRGSFLSEVVTGDCWGLGTNRLDIVDGDNGKQPFISNNNRYICVFNGEIYNFLKLKKCLVNKGFSFKSNCDSEVVVIAFEAWGVSSFDKFDGMFAIAIYDTEEDNLILARDRYGIKPVYYTENEIGLFFASEIKALNPKNNQIEELLPGHYKTAETSICYRSMLKHSGNVQKIPEQDPKTLRELISSAVEKRVQTNLPVAILLSGGIDSSIIMYEAIKHHDNVTAFVIGKEDSEDCVIAKRLCEHLNVKIIHVDICETELIALIEETVFTIESFEPNHIRGGTLSLVLSKVISEYGFKVALCGEGADELFLGYDEFIEMFEAGTCQLSINLLGKKFVDELYRTQLQRVDRASMKHTLEVRVPFLDIDVVEYALNTNTDKKIVKNNGVTVTKFLLRQAYKDILPDYITTREKAVLSYGAGFSGNGEEGPFFNHAEKVISTNEFKEFKQQNSDYQISNKEEMLYFKMFKHNFGEQLIATKRPTVNRTKVTL